MQEQVKKKSGEYRTARERLQAIDWAKLPTASFGCPQTDGPGCPLQFCSTVKPSARPLKGHIFLD